MSLRRQRGRLFPPLVVAALSLVIAAWPAQSFQNGLGDANISFGGCTCHIEGQGGTEGGGRLEMWTSDPDPRIGQAVQVLINVTMTELSSNNKVGVFLLRDFSGGDFDRPSTDGWRVEDDPNGGGNSYVEVVMPGAGSQTSLSWNLTAPLIPGTYRLYSRAQHGGGATYYENNQTGLTFNVFTTVPLFPNFAAIRAWTSQPIRVGEEAVLYGEFFTNSTEDIEGITVEFSVDGEAVGLVEDFVFPGLRTRTVSLMWTPDEAGTHILHVHVDREGIVPEENEADNLASAEFTVAPPLPETVPGFEVLAVTAALLVAWWAHSRRRGSG